MKKIIIVIALITCTSIFSNPSSKSSRDIWQDIDEVIPAQQRISKRPALTRRSLSLDEQGLRDLLTGSISQGINARNADFSSYQPEIDLPLPDGGFIRVRASNSPILTSEVAEQYPDIRTWRVQGVDDPLVSGRLDFTPKGFHGMLALPNGDLVYIDPDSQTHANNTYHSLSKKKNLSFFKTEFNCKVHGKHSVIEHAREAGFAAERPSLAQTSVLDLITYKLAVAGTGEYTASQGGSSASAYASMITTINRINLIYQRDLGVVLNLSSTESLAYTNAATDPYTNNNAIALINENIQNMSAVVGATNYDLGHVFAQGNLGGLAYVGVPCNNNYKAGGATGINDPQGEIFSLEFVAHEIGHQLGATHTFNAQTGSCGGGNRSSQTAVEPGGGSTIMSYTGICGPTNSLQTHADGMFHSASIGQINSLTRSLNNCGIQSSTGSSPPTANAGSDGIIPVNTPFLLDGSATGGVSYSWDQTDVGTASNVDVDLGNNAIIRALLPSSSQDRYIPRLSDLFNGSTTKGEKLPQTVRDVNFDFVVRDGNGGVEIDDKKISVKDTGSVFSVLSHSSSQTITSGSSIIVSWSVAGTRTFPINCNNVDIKLLRVDGVKNDLKLNTPNDGDEEFIVPSATPSLNNARIMVACSNQPFFQISSGNMTVQQGGVDTTPPEITINGESILTIVQGVAYMDAGATAIDNIEGNINVSTSGSVNIQVPSVYTITYTATDSSGNSASKTREVTVVAKSDVTPPVINLNGSASVTISQGASYADAGATATDDVDGTVDVSVTGSVDIAVPGTYVITYTATDSSNNISTKIRTVTVIDTEPPIIILNGSANISISIGTNYTDLGATATDNVDGSVNVSVSGSVNTATLGVYILTYTAADSLNNTSNKTRTVTVSSNTTQDTTPPVITVNGSTVIDIIQGATYTEAGASALDNKDGVVSVETSGIVNTSIIGVYTVTYTAIDSSGNVATVSRSVNVKLFTDTTPPVIILLGENVVEIAQGTAYVDAGAIATDNVDSSVSISTSGSVNTSVIGHYNITYTAKDKAGNIATKTRIVNVVKKILLDNKPPVITLNGSSMVSIVEGFSYIELGATAVDDRDGVVNVVVSGVVDIDKLGAYNITYIAMDTAGNSSFVTRIVKVVKELDKEAPVITLEGESTYTVEVGQDYVDPGFEAYDEQDGIVSVTVSGEVDTNKTGEYILTYTATDAAGNTFEKKRTVIVEKGNNVENEEASSGAGSFEYLLFSLMLLGFRRKKRLGK